MEYGVVRTSEQARGPEERAWALLQPQFVSCRGQSASATSADSTFAAAWPKRKLDGPPGKKELRAALKRHKSFQ